MTQVRRVVVDTDTGIDDAHTLLYLAGRPDAEIVAITSVFGNCVEEDSTRNIGYVRDLLGLDAPISRGAAAPLAGAPRIAGHVHGKDGLGDLGHDRPMPEVAAENAAETLVRLAAENPGELDLLALGPLTNLAAALRIDPELFTRYRSVVLMGGSGPYAPPGTLLMVDANIDNDPLAAAAVFAAPRNELVMVGVNVTGTTILDERAIGALRASGTPVARFATEILDAYLDFYQNEWGRRIIPLHDPLAAGVLLDPSFATAWQDGPVNVRGDGFLSRARLMRTHDGLPPAFPYEPAPDTRVITAVDAPRFVADFVEVLTR
ncbi:inosine-uridine nucleoside N-ribohydrolase [Thermocatellispora tengchongensis]|uniref:Inosine-uridine nucleoside N-ribohydrolase n=1 Tax=Thermocatellispora tengchongensis TaxID=1073253 RepID=A0A840PHF6_9ACTN|nr:nucleoside hydrolase [Thermocatellispora tengchongensis]MBB5138399.1 inosine-uridine nucleoside N-ribohydrolase [Thermocatellispora tengchongensis]